MKATPTSMRLWGSARKRNQVRYLENRPGPVGEGEVGPGGCRLDISHFRDDTESAFCANTTGDARLRNIGPATLQIRAASAGRRPPPDPSSSRIDKLHHLSVWS